MKYIINLYNTITDAQAVADRLGITGTVLLNLKTIHVEDPTQEQVDAWIADADVKAIMPDQGTVCTDIGIFDTVQAQSQPTYEETFGQGINGESTQNTLAFNDGQDDWYYWHLPASSQRPRTDSNYSSTYTYANDGTNVDLYILDSGVSGAYLQSNGGAAANAKGSPDVIGIMHPEFEDGQASNGSTANANQGDPYRVMHLGVPFLNIGSGGIGGGGWQNEDTMGHGTYCAMFAAGKLAGMAKKSYIWSAKVMDGSGVGSNSGWLSDLELGMDAVINHVQTKGNGRGSIANISIGVGFYRSPCQININEVAGDTIAELLDDHEKIMGSNEIFICRSAGNGINDNINDQIPNGPVQASFVTGPRTGGVIPTDPWNIEGIAQDKLGVGALVYVEIAGHAGDPRNGNGWYNLQLSNFSNYGNSVQISAPGKNLVVKHWNAHETLTNGTYLVSASGTSFSSPIVAGAACLRQQQVPLEPIGLTKAFLLGASSKTYDYQNLIDYTYPHEQRWPIVNAIKYLDSPNVQKNDNIQTLKNSNLVAIRVNPYLYGVQTANDDSEELIHGPGSNGNQSKLARRDFFVFDETVKTDAGSIGIPYLHGYSHRVAYRFFGYLDLASGDPSGGTTLAEPQSGTPVVDAVDTNSANNGTTQLQVLSSAIDSTGILCRVWLVAIDSIPLDWPSGQPFDVPTSITTGAWNGKFLAQGNASGVYFGKIENMNIATTSTVTDNVSALNGWIVFKATSIASDNHSSDGNGLKVANLSGTNSLGIQTGVVPNVTLDAAQYGNGLGAWDDLHWRDGLISDIDSDNIGTVPMLGVYDQQADQNIRDYLPIKETSQNILFNWYVEKELMVPDLVNGGFISTTTQTVNAKQNDVINLNLGMCWIDTTTNSKIGYQHLEADPTTYTISGGTIPDGLFLDNATGQLTGTITADVDIVNQFTITASGVNAVYIFNITELLETGYFYDGTDLKLPGRVLDNWVEVTTDNYQLEINKNYMVDSYALNPAPMNFILPSSAKMGDTIQLIDATRVQAINNWIINPNGLSIAGSGTGNYTISSGDSLEFVYFESTRSTSLNAWIVYNRGKI